MAGKQQMLFNRDGQKMDGIVLRKQHRDSGWAGLGDVYLDMGQTSKRILGATKPFCFFLEVIALYFRPLYCSYNSENHFLDLCLIIHKHLSSS